MTRDVECLVRRIGRAMTAIAEGSCVEQETEYSFSLP